MGCWGPTTDKVIFEFYCDPGAGCDTEVQFWYRLTPSPVGAGEESVNAFLFSGQLRDVFVSSTSRGVAKGGLGVPMTSPFCQRFVRKQPITGGENDMIIW